MAAASVCRRQGPDADTQLTPLTHDTQVAGGNLWFGLPVTGIGNSLVSLSVVADAMRLDTNASPGRILFAQICAFANASCGSLTALQQTGYLLAAVQNAGTLSSDFTIVVRQPGLDDNGSEPTHAHAVSRYPCHAQCFSSVVAQSALVELDAVLDAGPSPLRIKQGDMRYKNTHISHLCMSTCAS